MIFTLLLCPLRDVLSHSYICLYWMIRWKRKGLGEAVVVACLRVIFRHSSGMTKGTLWLFIKTGQVSSNSQRTPDHIRQHIYVSFSRQAVKIRHASHIYVYLSVTTCFGPHRQSGHCYRNFHSKEQTNKQTNKQTQYSCSSKGRFPRVLQ